jgi:methylated-DNA-[protein]-cysteine S-methyltransferase
MEETLQFSDVSTPIGTFRITYLGATVRVVDLLEKGVAQTGVLPGAVRRNPPFPPGSPARQLRDYFRGERTEFDLEVEPDSASVFDRAVWRELRKVRAGYTVTYGELAKRVGHAGAARAVGGSMRRNPIPIVIPCHRCVGIGGEITGFGLGLWRKRWLLDHEGAWPLKSRSAEGPRPHGQRTLDALLEQRPGGRSEKAPT